MAVPVFLAPLITTDILNCVPTFSIPWYSLLEITRWLIDISHSVLPTIYSLLVWLEADAFSIRSHFSEMVQLFAPAMMGAVPDVPA
jgi:hypothetical protein